MPLTTILPGHISRMIFRSSAEIVGSKVWPIRSETVPPVFVSEANSSWGVVRKLNHQDARGIASTIVVAVNCGGIENPLRVSRIRGPASGVSTVKYNVSQPAPTEH